jgi:hypothetical protein
MSHIDIPIGASGLTPPTKVNVAYPPYIQTTNVAVLRVLPKNKGTIDMSIVLFPPKELGKYYSLIN